MSIFNVPIHSESSVIDDRQINVLRPLPKREPGSYGLYNISLPIITNMVTGIPADENVLGGINLAMTLNELDVVIDPWEEMDRDDFTVQATYAGEPPFSVVADSVKDTELGQRIFRPLPANQLRDGICELRVGVRRISNPGGDYTFGAPLTLLIKTILPGGPDPDPKEPYHQSLPPIQVDKDVLLNGVTKDYLDEYSGLPCVIPAYPFMRKNSVIILHYGAQNVPLPRVTAAQVGSPIRFTIPRSVIEREGTAIPLKLNHSIMDVVENRTAAPSIPVFFNANPTLDLLEAPIVDQSDENDRLDIVALNGEDVLTIISTRKISFMPGDKVKMQWLGVDSGGREVPDEQVWQPTQSTRTHDFPIPYYKARLISRGSATVDYKHTRGTTITDSRKAYVTVTGLPVLLLPPEVPEAIGGSVPAQTPVAHVIVKSQPGAIILGDVLRVYWRVTRVDGSQYTFETQRSVSEALVDKDISFDIPATEIERGDGGRLTVSCQVFRPLVQPQLSEQLLLFIGDTLSELPPPEVPAVRDETLVPENVPLGAEVIIKPYDGMRDQDLVKLDFVGVNPQSSWSRTWDALKPEEVGRSLTERIPFEVLVANRNQEVGLIYTVTNRFSGRIRTSQKLRFRIAMPVPAPDITMIRNAAGIEIPRDSQTFSNSATLSGTAGVSVPVEIRNNGKVLATVTSTPQRTWSYLITPLAPGAYSFTVQTPDSNRPSAAWAFTAVESTVPTVNFVRAPDERIPHNGGTYYQSRITITGTATSGHRIDIRDGATLLGRVTAIGGIWILGERNYSVGRHTITATSTDGSNHVSQPYVFTVQEGLREDTTNFYHQTFNNWRTGNAAPAGDLTLFFSPTHGQYVLKNYTYTNASAGNLLNKTFNNFTPYATYTFTIRVARFDGRFAYPILSLRTNAESSPGLHITHDAMQNYTLRFTPTTPRQTLYIDSWLSTGVGNDSVTAWIQIVRQ